jgi:hypothetical protein
VHNPPGRIDRIAITDVPARFPDVDDVNVATAIQSGELILDADGFVTALSIRQLVERTALARRAAGERSVAQIAATRRAAQRARRDRDRQSRAAAVMRAGRRRRAAR